MSLRARIALVLFGLTTFVVVVSGVVINQLTEVDIRNSLDEQLIKQTTQAQNNAIMARMVENRRIFGGRNSRQNSTQRLQQLLDVQIPTNIQIGEDVSITTEGYPDFSESVISNGFSDVEVSGEKWRVLTRTFEIADLPTRRRIEGARRAGSIRGQEPPPPQGAQGRPTLGSYQVLIQTAVKRDSVNTNLQSFRERFILIGALGIIIAGLAGWLLGSTVLRPLERLGKHTTVVSDSTDLSNRVLEKYGPPEVEALAREINEMLSRLEVNALAKDEALKSAREFASNVAHELRTPLTSIRTNLDLLRMHPTMNNDDRTQILTNLVGQHERLANTLESLRLLARSDLAEAGVFEEVDFSQLISSVVLEQEKQSPAIPITLKMPSEPPLLLAWYEGLTLLFRNVIENAQVHAPGSRSNIKIEITVEFSSNELSVTIDDNGIGIPEADREQVSERFVRGSNVKGSGSGLGLALVKQQAELHGGFIRISESPSGGTRVLISLPT